MAGSIMVKHLTSEEIARINQLGESLATGIREVFARKGIKAQVTGFGSVQNLHFTSDPVVDFKTAQMNRKQLMHLVHLCLMERGIFIPARGLFALSTRITDKEVDSVAKAMDDIMGELKPVIENTWPELVG